MRLLFANPDWLVLCSLTLGLTATGLTFAFLHARRRCARLLGPAEAGRVRGWPDAALFAALLLLVVALLGPRIGHETVSVSTAGVDTILLLDVSRSMQASDVPPSRLDRARRIAKGLLERLEPGDRAALAAFSGRGVVLTPLSPDTAALVALLPAIDTDLITPGGSNLRDGVERSLKAFDPVSERSRVLVVLSDGEAIGNSNDPGTSSAVRANTRVVGVALGSEIGATVPNDGKPLVDRTRRVVISRRRRAPMQNLADATDGRLLIADEWGAVDLDALTREVRRSVNQAKPSGAAADAGAVGGLGERSEGWTQQTRTVPVVLPFAALALVILWLEAARPARLPRLLASLSSAVRASWRGERWLARSKRALGTATAGKGRQAAVALCIALPLLLTGATSEREREANADAEARAWESLARERPLRDSELLRLGIARAEARRTEEAYHAFRAVALGASELDLAAIAYHDLGVLALERGDLGDAREAFLDALALDPANPKTRFNLEWTLRALASQPPPLVEPPRKGERDNDEPAKEDRPSDSHEGDELDLAGGNKRGDNDPEDAQKGPETGDGKPNGAPSRGKSEPAGESREAGGSQQEVVGGASPLDARQREMWLQRVQDDPSKALRSAASSGRPSRRSSGPTW